MNTKKSTERKTDLFWIILSIVSLGTGLFIYQAGKAYSLSLMFALTALILGIEKHLTPRLFNLLRIACTLGFLFLIAKEALN